MLKFNKKSGQVDWSFDGIIIPNVEQVKAEFDASEYSQYFFLEKAVQDTLNHFQQQKSNQDAPPLSAQSFPVAEKRDAETSVELDNDSMAATLCVKGAYAGNIPDAKKLNSIIANSGVVKGVRFDLLQNLAQRLKTLPAGESLSEQVAFGQQPVHGNNGYIEFLTKSAKDRLFEPQEKEDGKVDMRDLGDPITVNINQPLARKHPPTPGEAGFDVLGNPLPPTAGKEVILKVDDGSMISLKDPNLLISTKEGLPLTAKDSVKVDDVMVLKKVDVTVGHVRFSGSLIIKGDVGEGMKVESDGDIHICGSVDAATVIAGGSIIVNNGVIGHKQTEDADKYHCKLQAKGDITVQFAQYSKLESQKDIIVLKHASHCFLESKNQIFIGPPQQANGRLIGGELFAEYGLTAGEIGAPSGAKTIIKMGTNLTTLREQVQVIATNNKSAFEAMKLAAHRVKNANEKGDAKKVATALKEFKSYKQQAKELELALETAKEQLERIKYSTATTATKKLHSRVIVSLGDSTLSSEREHGPSIVHFSEGKLIIEPKTN